MPPTDDDAKTETEINAALEKRLASLEAKIDLLIKCIVTPDTPSTVKNKGFRVKARDYQACAKRARMGRAAKRAGMSLDQWLSTHGETDKLSS
jgi:hypothetical protein